jgi:hypothetical protein
VALLERYLRVKKSLLPEAGKGLFTRIDIARGTRIVEYKGILKPWAKVKHLDGYNGYLMRVNRNVAIDALPAVSTFGRYANDAQGFGRIRGLSNNSEYVTDGLSCYIEAKRKIKAGEEIFVSYGKEYWGLMRKIKKEKMINAKHSKKR